MAQVLLDSAARTAAPAEGAAALPEHPCSDAWRLSNTPAGNTLLRSTEVVDTLDQIELEVAAMVAPSRRTASSRGISLAMTSRGLSCAMTSPSCMATPISC